MGVEGEWWGRDVPWAMGAAMVKAAMERMVATIVVNFILNDWLIGCWGIKDGRMEMWNLKERSPGDK